MTQEEYIEIPESVFKSIKTNIGILEAAIRQDLSTEMKMIFLDRIKNELNEVYP
ncbi:MAG: hypothetical protein WC856_02260 [Methylococcaceae bacterium]|jgi:hypothetical protein